MQNRVFGLAALLVALVACSSSSSTSSSSGTSGTSDAGSSFACGSATCDGKKEFCQLTYDVATGSWTPSSCTTLPSNCSDPNPCICIANSPICGTTVTQLRTKCSVDGANVTFGCSKS